MRSPGRHRGEPRQPDRGGRGGDPGQRPQPAVRRVPVADPARRCCSTPSRTPTTGTARSPSLESATVDDATDFFARYYAPGNAVLAVVGRPRPRRDAWPWSSGTSVTSRGAASRPGPTSPSPPPPRSGGRSSVDPHAPAPAVALAWRVPDPADLASYLPMLALAGVLGSGDASRLTRRLVHADRIATDAGSHVSFMENPLDVRDPPLSIAEVRLPEGGDPDAWSGRSTRRSPGWRPTGVSDRRAPPRGGARLGRAAPAGRQRDGADPGGRVVRAAAREGRARVGGPEMLRAGDAASRSRPRPRALTPSTRARLDVVPGSAVVSPAARAVAPREVPALARAPPARLPRTSERVLPNGLRVVAVRRPPCRSSHVRLRVPTATERAERPRPHRAARPRRCSSAPTGAPRTQLADDAAGDGRRTPGVRRPRRLHALGRVAGTRARRPARRPRRGAHRGHATRAGASSASGRGWPSTAGCQLSQPPSAAADAWAARRYGEHPYGRRIPRPEEVLEIAPGLPARRPRPPDHPRRRRPGPGR